MKKLFVLFFIALISCDTNDIVKPTDQIIGDIDVESDDFSLREAFYEGDSLIITVQYSGGCKQHSFTLVWPEAIIAIHPPQFGIYLVHDGNDDSCEAYLTNTIRFDLTKNPLGLNVDAIKEGEITLINGSNKDEMILLKP